MASIEVRQHKTCTSFRVSWLQDGAKQFETFGDRFDAGRFKIDVEQAGGRWPDGWIKGIGWQATAQPEAELHAADVASVLTVAEFASSWVESDRCEAAVEGRLKYHNIQRDHLASHAIGSLAVGSVTRVAVQEWLRELAAKGLSHKTIRNLRGHLSSVMAAAVAEDRLKFNPVNNCAIPKDADPDDAREPVFLTKVEYADVLVGIPAAHKALIETLAGTGARWGEVLALRVNDVDLSSSPACITINKARKPSLDGNHRIGRPKTAAGRRTVPISDRLATMLAAHIGNRGRGELLFDNIGNSGTWWRNVWNPAIERAGLVARPRIHDLRHSHASWLLSGTPPMSLFEVSKRLGHKNISITADVYGHLDRAGSVTLLSALEAM